ncbi:MAG TPA: hypothetical protein VI248_01800 [Kineosporiaceae bacterium]
MNDTITLVGGPKDGQSIPDAGPNPSGVIRVPDIHAGWLAAAITQPEATIQVGTYRQRIDHGHPSRDDQGHLRYDWVGWGG